MKLTKLGALALSACLAGGCLAGCAANEATPVPDTGPTQEQPTNGSEEATNQSSDEEVVAEEAEAAPVHEHIWIPNYELEVIPAETETIHHDAVTEDVIEYHTVCNECLAIVDGIAEQHAAETGHVGSTPDVAVPVTRTVTEASDEIKETVPEKTQLVSTSETCTTCGETRETEKKTVDPEAVSQAAQEQAENTAAAK